MAKLYILALLALLASAAFAQDTTVVQVAEVDTLHSQEFAFQIEHIEQTETGKTVVDVAFVVDINNDLTVEINDNVVPFGLNTIQLRVAVLSDDSAVRSLEVVVRVFVGLESFTLEDGGLVHRVVIQARVIEIEDTKYWETDILEQTVQIFSGGRVEKTAVTVVAVMNGQVEPNKPDCHLPPANNNNNNDDAIPLDNDNVPYFEDNDYTGESECQRRFREFMEVSMAWFHSLPFIVRVIISFLFGVCCGFITIYLIKGLSYIFCCGGSKKCKRTYAETIRVHTAVYTAVPLEEKEEKKEVPVSTV